MNTNSNIQALPGLGSASGGAGGAEELAALYGKLEALNTQVNEILGDPVVRRIALEVGVAMLAKKFPALGTLLGTLGGVAATTKQATAVRQAPRRHPPVVKRGRGIQ